MTLQFYHVGKRNG